jgi:hypothetical protein
VAVKAKLEEFDLTLWDIGGDAGTATRAREFCRSKLHCLWYVWLENKAWAGLSRPDADPKEHEADKIAILDSIQWVRQATWFEWKDGSRPFLLGVGKISVFEEEGFRPFERSQMERPYLMATELKVWEDHGLPRPCWHGATTGAQNAKVDKTVIDYLNKGKEGQNGDTTHFQEGMCIHHAAQR